VRWDLCGGGSSNWPSYRDDGTSLLNRNLSKGCLRMVEKLREVGEKWKFEWKLVGIVSGVVVIIIAVILVLVFRAQPKEIIIGPIKFEIPTATSTNTHVPTPTLTSTATRTPVPSTATPTNASPAPTDMPTATPIPPTPTDIPTRVREADNAEMVYVPAGEFVMGSDQEYDDQKPEHVVYVDAFWIDKYEITNAQYRLCVASGACGASMYDDDPRYNLGKQPVVGVYWTSALAYCQWAGARLPTEAEWEKAARGTDKRLYPWGDEFDPSKLNSTLNQGADRFIKAAASVGSFLDGASPYGVLDLSGNVWEWTSSLYRPYPYSSEDGREDPTVNSTATRAVRGGSWNSELYRLTTTWRNYFTRGTRYPDTGFRCAVSAQK